MKRLLVSGLVFLWTLGPTGAILGGDPPAQPREDTARYEFRKDHDPNGIGKFYMGREIAQVMGHLAAEWLERPERDREEQPTKLLDALKIKPGEVVADIGAG